MYEHILEEVERVLEQDEDIIVPVRKIWTRAREVAEDNDWRMPSLAEFTSLLIQDDRFEFMPELETSDLGEHLNEEEREETGEEEFGIFSGQWVKLARIQLSPERLGDIIRRKVDGTIDTLMKAWEDRPKGDAAAEDRLLEVLSQTQKLQREVKDTFSEVKMKSLTEALERNEKKNPPKTSKKATERQSVGKKKATARSKTSSRRKPKSKKRKK